MILSDAHEDWLVKSVRTRRLLAWLVDGILVAILVAAAWYATLLTTLATLGLGFHLFGLLPLIPLAYTWGFTASPMAATPGMALADLILARDADLTRPGGLATLFWSLGYYITIAAGAIWLAVCLITTRKRTIHDLVSGLVVVRASALTEYVQSGIIPPGGIPPA